MTYLISKRIYFPEAIKRLAEGSFEHVTSRVEAEVRKNALRLFGEQIEAKVVGTFPGYAVAVADNGKAVRFRFEDTEGSIRIGLYEAIQVDSIPAEQRYTLAQTESNKVAELLQSGQLVEARAKLKGLTRLVDGRSPVHDEQLVDAIIGFRKIDRPWRQAFSIKADEIRRSMLDEATQIAKDRIEAKFKSLLNGAVAEDQIDTYRELVTDCLEKLQVRTATLQSEVVSALQALRDKPCTDANVSKLLAFGDDLADDLASTDKTIRESLARILRTESRAKLHDVLAEDFRDRELSGRFVIKMSKRLSSQRLVDAS